MGRWSLALAPSFLRFACTGEPDSLLDLGCGTGSLVRAAAETYARATIGRDRADLVVGLVEPIPFANGGFDCCLSLLLLQEIQDRELALNEMRRVTRQGGIVAACQWDFGQGMPMLATIREVVHEVSPEAYESLGTRQTSPFASEAELR